MTPEDRSIQGFILFDDIRRKLDAGATFKKPSSAEFYSDQIPRFKKSGSLTSISPSQLKWLEDIDKFGLTKGRKSK